MTHSLATSFFIPLILCGVMSCLESLPGNSWHKAWITLDGCQPIAGQMQKTFTRYNAYNVCLWIVGEKQTTQRKPTWETAGKLHPHRPEMQFEPPTLKAPSKQNASGKKKNLFAYIMYIPRYLVHDLPHKGIQTTVKEKSVCNKSCFISAYLTSL